MRVVLAMDFISTYTTNIIGFSMAYKHAQSDGLYRALDVAQFAMHNVSSAVTGWATGCLGILNYFPI